MADSSSPTGNANGTGNGNGNGADSTRAAPARKRRLHTRLHRSLGVWSLAIVLVIAVTGLLLNHGGLLKLDEKRVTSGLILRHYGVEPAGDPIVYEAGDGNLLAVWDGQLVFNEFAVREAPPDSALAGAGEVLEGEFVFVFEDFVFVVDGQGNLIDQLDSASLPPGKIARAGTSGGDLLLDTGADTFALKDWLEPVPFRSNAEPRWFTPLAEVTPAQRETLATGFRGEGLPLSRVILDLHSGKLFGVIGVILYDLAAVALVILGITGVQLWFRRR